MAQHFYSSIAALSTLAVTAAAGDATLYVPAATFVGYPTSYPYTIRLEGGAATEELVDVTGAPVVSGSNLALPVTRGVDGSGAKSHPAGVLVDHPVVARDLTEASSHVYDQSGLHVPAGVILPFGASAAPAGYLLCDGTSYLRATYPALFAAIGTSFGSADGTHFTVPNLRGRFLAGVDGSSEFAALNTQSGAKTHSHPLSDAGQAALSWPAASGTLYFRKITASYAATIGTTAAVSATSAQSIAAGSAVALMGATDPATAATDLPPYVSVNYLIKT